MRYLSANFGLPTPLCSRLRSDVRDRQTDRQTDRQPGVRQTDVRRASSLNAPPIMGGGIINAHIVTAWLIILGVVSKMR